MKHLKEPDKKYDMLGIVILNLILMSFFVFVFKAGYETDDDFYIQGIAAGLYGEKGSPFIVFSNVIYGCLLKFAYALIPKVSWGLIIYFVLMFLSYAAIELVLIERLGKTAGISIYLMFAVMTMYHFLVTINFTRVAALLTMAGYFILFHYLKFRKKGGIIVGSILLIFGSMLRLKSWMMISAIAFGIWLFETLTGITKTGALKQLKSKKQYFSVLSIVFAIIFLLSGIDKAVYKIQPEWNEYHEYNVVRSELLDYGTPSWDEYKEEYKELGLTENDYLMITSWTLADFDKLSVDTLKKVLDIRPAKQISVSAIAEVLKNTFISMAENSLFVFAILSILALAFLLKKPPFLLWIYLCLSSFGLSVFMHWTGRYPNRVLDGIGAALCLFVLWGATRIDLKLKIKNRFIGCVIAVVIAVLLSGELYFSPETYQKEVSSIKLMQEERKEIWKYNEGDNLYLMDVSSGVRFDRLYPIFQAPEANLLKNYYYLGGWLTLSPHSNQLLKNHGVDNPMKALYERDDVFLVDKTKIENKIIFIRDKYDKEASWSIYDNLLGREVVAINPNFDKYSSTASYMQIEKTEIDEINVPRICWLSGSLKIDNEPEAKYFFLEFKNKSGKKTFQINVQKTEQEWHFRVGIPETEMLDGKSYVRLLIKTSSGEILRSKKSYLLSSVFND